MKYSNQNLVSRPAPKNKDFLTWTRAEACKHEDQIISSEWREKLKKTSPFVPAYRNAPVNMVYLLSGEYGRIWEKERDEWYRQVFVLRDREKDIYERKKKIRKQIQEAKRLADISIKERKERKAKEKELKAKADAEKAEKAREKLKAKQQKNSVGKKKSKKTEEEPPKKPEPEEPKTQTVSPCPEGYRPVEVTVQFETPAPVEEARETESKAVDECEKSKNKQLQSTGLCDDYLQQLKEVQAAKNEEIINEVRQKQEQEEQKSGCQQKSEGE